MNLEILNSSDQIDSSQDAPKPSGGKRGRKGGAKKTTIQNAFSYDVDMTTYIFRILKQEQPNVEITKDAIKLVNEMLIDFFDKSFRESRELISLHNKQTLGIQEVKAAVKLQTKGELRKGLVQAGEEAYSNFIGE